MINSNTVKSVVHDNTVMLIERAWSGRQKMWASSCWNLRTRVRPLKAPDNSLRCRTPKSAKRTGSSFHDRGRWSNIKLVKTTHVRMFIIHADYIVQRHRYCDDLVMVFVCWWVCAVNMTISKTPDRNDLKLGTVVVCNTVSKPIDFGLKGYG